MKKTQILAAMGIACLAVATSARASTVAWTTWDPSTATTSATTGGVAHGLAGSLGVTYTGQLLSVSVNYPSWTPANIFTGSYAGGSVDNAPLASQNTLQISGGQGTATNTITFDHPVVNPVMAIWSLGQPGHQTSFNFDQEPTIVNGGTASEYNFGMTITQSGNNIYGIEGNGTIVFKGTYSSITWTNPVNEFWYGFTVGVPAAVPLPAGVLGGGGLLLALGGMKLAAKRLRRA